MTGVGDVIAARYRVVSRVGGGSMGVVWRARDDVLRRDVAVKELLLQPGISAQQADEARRRAMREGRITARLHDANAITVYDVAEHNGRPCLIMEFLPSTSLADVLVERTVLPVIDVALIGQQVASALASAHDAGIVHRDVKPGNVLLTDDGTAKLTDFGISRAVGDGTITATGVLAGTPAYLPPEVVEGQDADFRSDVFSLGATLYAAVEGTPPFGLTDNPIAMLHQIATKDIIPPTKSGALTSTIVGMLAKDPTQRPTMRQAQEALAAVADGTTVEEPAPAPVAAVPVVAPPPEPEPTKALAAAAPATAAAAAAVATAAAVDGPAAGTLGRRKALVAAMVVIVLVLVGGTIALLSRGGTSSAAVGGPSAPVTTTSRHAAPPPVSSSAVVQPTTDPVAPTTTTAVPITTTPLVPTTSTQLVSSNPGTPTQFIIGYYKLMPGDTADGWGHMTAGYQQKHAGGWSGYTSFWAQIASVALSGVAAEGSDGVVATITYHYKDGKTVVERTSFGLVKESGAWKIASSSVLSSHDD
jgi:hypothetical protein